jgi:hypothetical protein
VLLQSTLPSYCVQHLPYLTFGFDTIGLLIYYIIVSLAKHFIRTNIELELMHGFMSITSSSSRVETDHYRWGKVLISSNTNELYKRVIYRNNTLIDLLTTSRSMPKKLVINASQEIGTKSREYTS